MHTFVIINEQIVSINRNYADDYSNIDRRTELLHCRANPPLAIMLDTAIRLYEVDGIILTSHRIIIVEDFSDNRWSYIKLIRIQRHFHLPSTHILSISPSDHFNFLKTGFNAIINVVCQFQQNFILFVSYNKFQSIYYPLLVLRVL